MTKSPLVSILAPCYNVERFLPKCLDTILGQSHAHLQVVLIDDGSKDGTWRIMQEYAAKDSRLEIYHQENQGVAATRNHLLDKARGEYVLFVDSDDWVELDMVEFLVGRAVETRSPIVTCKMVTNDDPFVKAVHDEEIWEQPKAVLEFLRHVEFNGSLWNKLVVTSLLHNVRFHCGISYGEDALFLWQVLQRADRVLVTNKVLYHYRMNDDSLSHQAWTPGKKGTGHLVWTKICEDAKEWWPQYVHIGLARFAIEDMWGLYFASLSNYPHDGEIKERQRNIKRNLKWVRSTRLVGWDKILVAYILAYCYPLGRLLKYTRR